MSDRLTANQQLNINDQLLSPNGKFKLVMQGDGNLVLYSLDANAAVWASNTWNTPVTHAIMQPDGNFVCYDNNGKAYWDSNTSGNSGAFAVLQDDGILAVLSGVVANILPKALWAYDRLLPNQQLKVNQQLLSPNGKFRLVMQADGNLVLYSLDTNTAVWSSNTWDTPVTHAIMQADGNFVCYDDNGKAYWSSNTWGHPNTFVVLQGDGKLVISEISFALLLGVGLWASDMCIPNVPWQNYPKNLPSLTPAFTCVPATINDIISIITKAEQQGMKVHARGSGWSFSDCAITGDFFVTTAQLNKELQTVQKALIAGAPLVYHVEAGISIHDLYGNLDKLGFGLETMGGSSGQTLAGAISTGTHGGDRFSLAGLADSVLAIHIVGAAGTQYWIEPTSGITNPALLKQYVVPNIDPKNIIYDTATFNACLVSLGCMGVIYAVVLRVRRQYDLIETTIATTWERFLRKAWAYLNDADKRFLQVAISPYPNTGLEGNPGLVGNSGDHLCLITTRRDASLTSPLGDTAGRPSTDAAVQGVITQMVHNMDIDDQLKLYFDGVFGDDSQPIDVRFVNLVQGILTQAADQRHVLVAYYAAIMLQLLPPTQPGLVPIFGTPSVVSWGPGRIDVFPVVTVNGSYNTLWTNYFEGVTWNGYVPLGPIPKADPETILGGQPCVVSWGPNRIDVFLHGTDGALWTKSWNGTAWTDYVQLGAESIMAGAVGQPSAVCWGPNRIDVFVQRADKTLWTKSWNGTAWSDYSQLSAQPFAYTPTAVSWGPNRIDLFVQGNDNALWTKSWNGTAWTDFVQLGLEPIVGRPSAVCWGPNRIDVFVQRSDKTLWTKSWNGTGWSDYSQLSAQPFASTPNAVSWGPNRIDLFVQGTDNALWTTSWNGTAWSGFSQLGPEPIVGPPSVVCWGVNSIFVLVVFVAGNPNLSSAETGLWMKSLSGAGWSEDYVPVGTPLRGASYSIMDTTYGHARLSSTGSYSIEVFFPASDDTGNLNANLVAFVNAAINAINAATDTLLLGYMSLRFTGMTRATLGMQQWAETCAVEVSVLQGVQNELPLITSILALAYQHGGLSHWGQIIDQGVPVPVGAGSIHPGYAAWRQVYAKMSNNFSVRTFENGLSVRWKLTTA